MKKKIIMIAILILTICLSSNVNAKIVDDTSYPNPSFVLPNNVVLSWYKTESHFNAGTQLSIKANATTTLNATYLYDETDKNGRTVSVFLINQFVEAAGTRDIGPGENDVDLIFYPKSSSYNNLLLSTADFCGVSTGQCTGYKVSGRVVPIDYSVYQRIKNTDLLNKTVTYQYYDDIDHIAVFDKGYPNDNHFMKYSLDDGLNSLYYDGIARMYKNDTKCSDSHEVLSSDHTSCSCAEGYAYNSTGVCDIKNVESNVGDTQAYDDNGNPISKDNTTIQDDGRVTDKYGNQLYDKDGKALYIKDSNIKQEQVKVGDTGINSYVAYFVGFIVLLVGSIVVIMVVKKHKKSKQV